MQPDSRPKWHPGPLVTALFYYWKTGHRAKPELQLQNASHGLRTRGLPQALPRQPPSWLHRYMK